MTNEEIKKALSTCAEISCDGCPYAEHSTICCYSCSNKLKLDARDLIIKQEKDIKQLKTECALLDDELRNARQETINVLNKLKEKAIFLPAIETYHVCNLVDEMIKELIK